MLLVISEGEVEKLKLNTNIVRYFQKRHHQAMLAKTASKSFVKEFFEFNIHQDAVQFILEAEVTEGHCSLHFGHFVIVDM